MAQTTFAGQVAAGRANPAARFAASSPLDTERIARSKKSVAEDERVPESVVQANYEAVDKMIQASAPSSSSPSRAGTAKKTAKSQPVIDNSAAERSAYLRGLDVEASRARVAELTTMIDAEDAVANNLGAINSFLPGNNIHASVASRTEGLKEERTQLLQDVVEAERLQTNDRYFAMRSNADYAENAVKKSAEPWRLNPSAAWASADEVGTYHYIYNTQGGQAAVDYLNFMAEEWNRRSGKLSAENLRDLDSYAGPEALRRAMRGLATTGYGIAAGLDQWKSGAAQVIENIAGDGDRLATSAFQYGSAAVRDDLKGAGKLGYDVAVAAGNMIPSLTTTAMTGGASAIPGLATMGASVYGNSYNQALGEGYSKRQAGNYAAITTASETCLQYILGGIPGLGGKVPATVSNWLAGARSGISRAAAQVAANAGGEFTEEYLQEVLTPVFRNLTLGDDETFTPVSEEAIYAGVIGALTAGIIDGTGTAFNRATSRPGSAVQPSESAQPAVTQPEAVQTTMPAMMPGATTVQTSTPAVDTTSPAVDTTSPAVDIASPAVEAAPSTEESPTPPAVRRISPKDATTVAKTIVSQYDSSADQAEIAADIEELTAFFDSPAYDASQAMLMAYDVAEKITSSAVRREDNQQMRVALRRAIRSTAVSPSAEARADAVAATGVTDWAEFRRRFGGRLSLSSTGRSADSVYQELQNTYGTAYFPEVSTEGEALAGLVAAYDAVAPVEEPMFSSQKEQEDATWELAANIALGAHKGMLLDIQFFADGGDGTSRQTTPAPPVDNAGNRRLFAEKMEGEGVFQPSQAAMNTVANMAPLTEAEAEAVGFDEQTRGYVSRTEEYNRNRAAAYILEHGHDAAFQFLMDNAVWGPDGIKMAAMLQEHYAEIVRTTAGSESYTAAEKLGMLKDKSVQKLSMSAKEMQASAEYGKKPEDVAIKMVREALDESTLDDSAKDEVLRNAATYVGRISGATVEDTVPGILEGVLSPADIRTYQQVRYSRNRADIRTYQRMRSQLDAETIRQLDEVEAQIETSRETLIGIIKEMSRIRHTGKFFTNEISSTLENSLWQEDVESLRDYANTLVAAMANDYVAVPLGRKLKTWSVTSMLFNLATTARNLIGNTTFSAIDTLAVDTGVLLDMALSKFTGTRSRALDQSRFTPEKRRGIRTAGRKAYIQTALDVSVDGAENGYERSTSRSFRMRNTQGEASFPVVRFLSTMEKYLGYALNVTDARAKGGARAEATRGLEALQESGKLRAGTTAEDIAAVADQEALYRTFQDDSRIARTTVGLRNAANELAGIEGYGLGDAVLPFAKTPANLVSRALAYTPLGAAKGFLQVAEVVASGEDVTIQQQRNAVDSLSRGMTGTGLIAMFAAFALAGLLKSAEDEEDKNAAALNAASGLSGTQLNVSAALRLLNGESTDWQDGDALVGLSFLEPFATQMAIGTAIAEEMKEADRLGEQFEVSDAALASLYNSLGNLLEMPALESISDIYDAGRYSTADSAGGKVADALLSIPLNLPTQFIPALSRQAARATDEYYRDVYTSDSGNWLVDSLQEAKAEVMNVLPGARQMLPTKQDSFGNERTYGTNAVVRWLNAFVNPSSLSFYKDDSVTTEIRRLAAVTGDVAVYPARKAPSGFSYDGTKHELTYEQRRDFQIAYGQSLHATIEGVLGSDAYKGLSANEQAKLIASAKEYASAYAKYSYLNGEYENGLLTKVDALAEAGLDYADYWVWDKTLSAMSGETKQEDVVSALTGSGLTEDQQVAVYFNVAGYNVSAKGQEAIKGTDASMNDLALWQYRFKRMELQEDADNTAKRQALYDSKSLSAGAKEAIDSALLSDGFYIPVDKDVKYTDDDAFYVSQMSDSGQKRYEAFAKGYLTGEEWSRIYSAYSAKKKADIISGLVAEGWSRADAETLYGWIKKDYD